MKAALIHKTDAMCSPGGGEVQLLETAAALDRLGVDTSICAVDELDNSLPDAQIFHFFGTVPEFLPAMEYVASKGFPCVVSTIAWYDRAAYWHESDRLLKRLIAVGRFSLRAACPFLPSWRKRLYKTASLLLPNSEAESVQLRRYFGVKKERIRVVPNGVDLRFAAVPSDDEIKPPSVLHFLKAHPHFDLSKAVLCVGRIEPRKNQLGLIRAWREEEYPLVFVGDPLPEHEDYYKKCFTEAPGNAQFLGFVDHDDPVLIKLYAEAACLVLPSRFETPGLVALEAALTGTPLVLTECGCTQEYFGDLVEYAAPDDRQEIRKAINRAIARGRRRELADLVLSRYTWDHAAEATHAAYASVLPY